MPNGSSQTWRSTAAGTAATPGAGARRCRPSHDVGVHVVHRAAGRDDEGQVLQARGLACVARGPPWPRRREVGAALALGRHERHGVLGGRERLVVEQGHERAVVRRGLSQVGDVDADVAEHAAHSRRAAARYESCGQGRRAEDHLTGPAVRLFAVRRRSVVSSALVMVLLALAGAALLGPGTGSAALSHRVPLPTLSSPAFSAPATAPAAPPASRAGSRRPAGPISTTARAGSSSSTASTPSTSTRPMSSTPTRASRGTSRSPTPR